MDKTFNDRWMLAGAAMAALLAAGLLATQPAGGGINGGGRFYGAIDEFGSIFVNGVEFELGGATITIDDQPGTEADLRLGQLVTVDGVVNLDGVTGNAVTVNLRNDLRGTVSAVDPTDVSFTLLAQKVRVDSTTLYGPTVAPQALAGIAPGLAYVVSGHRNALGELVATRIDRAATATPKIVGRVADLDGDVSRLTIGALTIDYAGAQLEGAPTEGALVEASGTLQSPTLLVASRVEVIAGGLVPGEGASIEGYVTAPLSAGRFALGSQVVSVSAATEIVDGTAADLVANVKVEAEGQVDAAGVLRAGKVTISWPAARAHGVVTRTPASGGRLEVNGLVVETPPGTAYEDRSELKLRRFSLADIRVGDTIEPRGIEPVAARTIRADGIQRVRPDGRSTIEGVASGVRAASLVLLDETVTVTPSTAYQDMKGRRLDAATFFAQAAGREVKARGAWTGTAFVADQLALKN